MNEKNVYRRSPCASYDIEGTECWLEDMAAKGLVLEKDGFFLGFASFEKQDPQTIRYRMEAAPMQTGFFSSYDKPDDDAVALNREFGWDYVATRDQFYIYAASDPTVPELNTDPHVQALTLQKIRKRERGSILSSVWWIIFETVLLFRGTLVRSVLSEGTWFVLYTVLMLACLTADSIARAVHLRGLYKRLQNAGTLNHRKAWQKQAMWQKWRPALQVMLIVGWIIWLMCNWSNGIMEKDTISIFDYPGDPPFATAADYAPNGSYTPEKMSFTNKTTVKSDPLAPVLMEWKEHADLVTEDGRTFELGLYFDYFETASPMLAKALVWEYERHDKRHKNYAPLELTTEHTLDYAALYTGDLHMPTLLLRKGSAVGRFQFHQFGDDKLTLDEWAKVTITQFEARN